MHGNVNVNIRCSVGAEGMLVSGVWSIRKQIVFTQQMRRCAAQSIASGIGSRLRPQRRSVRRIKNTILGPSETEDTFHYCAVGE